MMSGKPRFDKDVVLLFFHIFKTAGTSLNRLLEHQYSKEETVFIGAGSPESYSRGMELFSNISEDNKLELRYVGGAFLGIDETLPNPCVYFTLLRNPVNRVISEYNHVRSVTRHELHQEIGDMSLYDYVDRGFWLSWNGQVRNIRGETAGISAYGEPGPEIVTEEDYEKAKNNIDQKFIVGITERFDESILILKRTFGWPLWRILYLRLNVAKKQQQSGLPELETIKLIESKNQFDIKLYEYANQLLDQRINFEGSSFQLELKTFKLINAFYQFSWNTGLQTYLGIKKLLRLY